MDLSVLRRSEADSLEATSSLQQKVEPSKLSYSIASLLQTVQRAKASPAMELQREEKTEESDEESEISVDSNHDTSEDDRLAVSKEEEEEEQSSPPLLDLRLGLPPHLQLPPGLGGLPGLQGLLPPGWPGLALLQHHPAINNQQRHHPGKALSPHSGAIKTVE